MGSSPPSLGASPLEQAEYEERHFSPLATSECWLQESVTSPHLPFGFPMFPASTSYVSCSSSWRSPPRRANLKFMATPMTIAVAGATGLVGRHVIDELSRVPGLSIRALVRRPGAFSSAHTIEERLVDFDKPESIALAFDEPPPRVLFCCLGTTLAQAGSAKRFREIDLGIPSAIIDALKKSAPSSLVVLVSSVGAAPRAGLYLATKHDLEQYLIKSGLRYLIARPSLLLGERQERRTGEALGRALMPGIFHALRGLAPTSELLARYAPISAEQVAKVLVSSALAQPPTTGLILEGRALADG